MDQSVLKLYPTELVDPKPRSKLMSLLVRIVGSRAIWCGLCARGRRGCCVIINKWRQGPWGLRNVRINKRRRPRSGQAGRRRRLLS